MKPHVTEFLEYLTSNFTKSGVIYNPQNEHLKDFAKCANHISSMTKNELKTLISDKYWNSYPTYVCYSPKGPKGTTVNPKSYYNLIFRSVKNIVYSNTSLRQFFINHSQGIFRIATINSCLGRDKLKAAKVGLKCSDARARKLAVGLVKTSDLKGLLITEKRPDILNKISIRLGYLNMLEQEMTSRYRWNRSRAFLNSDFSADELRELLQKKKNGENIPFYDRDMFSNFAYNIDAQSVAFYLDIFTELSSSDAEIKNIFLKKLTGKSNS